MLSKEKVGKDVGGGLLVAAGELVMARNSQTYSNDYSSDSVLLDTYIEVITELRKIKAVDEWMNENKSAWSWLEQWLRPDSSVGADRLDLSRRDGVSRRVEFDQNHSDSDINNIHESDEDDDDSRFEATIDSYNSISNGMLQVSGAGIAQVNGIYTRTDSWDNVDLYTKSGLWEDKEEVFSLFRCRLSDNSKRWYISIIPRNNNPGTSKDIDFYLAPATGDAREVPHKYVWMSASREGSDIDFDPPPSVVWKQDIGLSDTDPAADSSGVGQ